MKFQVHSFLNSKTFIMDKMQNGFNYGDIVRGKNFNVRDYESETDIFFKLGLMRESGRQLIST